MSVITKSVNVCSELDALLGIVNSLIGDVLAKKPIENVVADAVPSIVVALGGLSQLPAELQSHQALDSTLALKAVELKAILAPTLP